MGTKPIPDTVGRHLFCPNCVPDYLNGFLDRPPVITPGYGCHRCGIGWDERDQEEAIRTVASMAHQYMDHVADWMAIFLANKGPVAIVNAKKLADDWATRYRDPRASQNMNHIVVLALYARYCQWQSEAWQLCQLEAEAWRDWEVDQ